VWGNSYPDIYTSDGSVPVVTWSDVDDGTGEDWFGTGCIEQDPQFVNAGATDYRLGPGSPCIDSGYGDYAAKVPMTDIAGRARVDDPDVANTGAGTPDYVDMGAREAQAAWDVVWRNSVSGMVYMWFMDGLTITSQGVAGTLPIAWHWQIKGVGDFDGDGNSDILWRNSVSGMVYIWFMNGRTIVSQGKAGILPIAWHWQIKGVGDFDGDGNDDIMWRNSGSGSVYLWLMNGLTISSQGTVGTLPIAWNWQIEGVGDFDGCNNADVLWRNSVSGTVYIGS